MEHITSPIASISSYCVVHNAGFVVRNNDFQLVLAIFYLIPVLIPPVQMCAYNVFHHSIMHFHHSC